MTQDDINETLERLTDYLRDSDNELLELNTPVDISIELEEGIPFRVDAIAFNDNEPILIEKNPSGNVFPPFFFVEEDDREKIYEEINNTLDSVLD